MSENFTEQNYRDLLNIAKESYFFKNFANFNDTQPVILWRHDVDFSVHRSVQLARIENEENVIATYFLLLNCEFYNIFETEIKNKIKEIISLGHSIGLHFDPNAYNITNKQELKHYLNFEKKILEELFDTTIDAFSLHNPTLTNLKINEFKLAGMINAYANIFKEDFGYCSDSNGYWRHDLLEDVLREAKFNKLQILTHPAWWQKEVMSPKQRIQRCLNGRSDAIENSYNSLLEKHNRKNIE